MKADILHSAYLCSRLAPPGHFDNLASPIVEGKPSHLHEDIFDACTTGRFLGSEEKVTQAFHIAFSNCIQ